MTDQDRRIFKVFARGVKQAFPEAKILAFGSRARGDAGPDSDFDTCIVLPHCDRAAYKAIRGIAWEVGFENERMITTILFEEADFDRGPASESALVGIIRREGLTA